jgi:hypothetical protein
MSKVWAKVKHEFREVLPPMIFFLVAFHIVLMERALMAREYGLHPLSMATATVTALVVAKVVLIADMLPIINRFPEKPLMYNVVWKTAIYVGASLLAHYLEHPSSRCGGARAFGRQTSTSGANWCGPTSGRSSSCSSSCSSSTLRCASWCA